MTAREESDDGRAENIEAVRTSTIDREYPRSPPLSPTTGNRFIVEPQVLNAAFELESGGGKQYGGPSLPHPGGGLPPPPRPYSRKGKPLQSTPSSPATSIDNSPASLPNSPTSSPYSNSPYTPGGSSDASPNPNVKPSPRLSNFLRGESLVFSARRRSVAEQGSVYSQKEEEESEAQGGPLRKWTSRDTGDGISPLDSVPSSPEQPTTPADGSRPSRHNRYLSGLQKITRLGKAKGSLSAFAESTGVRGGRRMSDAEVDPRRSSQDKGGNGGELSGRYRRMLDKGGKAGAGELMKQQPSSVPSSPVALTAVKRLF
ncbi:hypothetical protein C8Q77DRAFT_92245 [Trametes polyzona]|nr:hypothetical protein C8Q77DRAFT_92245 [Trametes polyzona]